MKITESIEEVQEYCKELKNQGKTVALIDTFGDLHSGHTSIINTAKSNADAVILFVWHAFRRFRPDIDYINKPDNPKENLLKYKQKEFNSDVELCEKGEVDLFLNFVNAWDFLSPKDIVTPLFPPGVKQVVEKRWTASIYNLQVWSEMVKIVNPDILVVGQKDFYQTTLISFVLNALNIPVKVVVSPTLRDSDGIAYSSRNKFLSLDERRKAINIYKTLKEISEWPSYPSVREIKHYFIKGCGLVSSGRRAYVKKEPDHVWYVDVCDPKTGEPLKIIDKEAAIVVAVNFGEDIHLSDNIVIHPR